jgi:hypothetical protein
MLSKRGAFEWDQLLPWLIAIAVFALIIFLYAILKGNAGEWITYIKNFLRFGR